MATRSKNRIWIVAALIFTLLLSGMTYGDLAYGEDKKVDKDSVEIFFTHDMHSHVEKFPKIKTIIDRAQANGEDPLVIDAGDFSMGTPYMTVFATDAAELRLMGYLDYDVTTIGNHEFDYRPAGLASMLRAAKKSGDRLPAIVAANIDWRATLADKKLKKNGENLKKAMEEYGVKDYQVFERNGKKIAVFGIFGKESASYAPESGTIFADPVESAKKTVEKIRKNEKEVNMIVCVSHSGTNQENPDKSEDQILAKEVEGIDLIISGHSHTELAEPIKEGSTYIVSCGAYNANIGQVIFRFNKDNKPELEYYKLIKLDSSIPDNPQCVKMLENYKGAANREYFSQFGYNWDQVLTKNDIEYPPIEKFGREQGEQPMANLFNDSYIYAVKQAEGKNYETIDVAVVPHGVIRDVIPKGDVKVSDAFNALSLGSGKDGRPGYPMVSVYLTGKELKLIPEIDISVSPMMIPARLYPTGLTYKYNPHRVILNRAYDIKLDRGNGKTEEIKDDKLYRVVADLYSAQMLGTVNSMSKGLLSIVPKDKNGNEVTNYEDQIIYRPDGSELKEWYCLASYLQSFPDGKIPAEYSKTEGRKVLVDSKNPINLLRDSNRYFYIMLGILAAVIVVVVLVIFLIVKLVKRKRRKRKEAKAKNK